MLSQSPLDTLPSPAPAAPAPTGPTELACESYLPGHLMHYTHQGKALRSAGVRARQVLLEGDVLRVEVDDETLVWRHHDPVKLRRLLGLVLGGAVLYRDQHALRVGPYWFNCAPEDLWTPCKRR